MARSFVKNLEWALKETGSTTYSGAKYLNRFRKNAGWTRKRFAIGMRKSFNSKAAKTLAKTSQIPGKFLFSPNAGFAAIGLATGAMTWDSEDKTFGSHMADESIKTAVDVAGFAASSLLGPLGVLAYGAADYMGFGAGALLEPTLNRIDKEYRKDLRGGITPIKHNERTMAAMQQSMSLLGQRPRGFLGNEASYMHN